MKKTIIERKRRAKPEGTAKGGRKKLDLSVVKSKTLSFKLTEETYNTINTIASIEKITQSEFITSAIDMKIKNYINKNQSKLDFELTEK